MTDGLRARLAQLEARMTGAIPFDGAHDPVKDAAAMKARFSQDSDLPLLLARHLTPLIREAMLGAPAEARVLGLDLFAQSITETLESVERLSIAGFHEGAWFRVNDAFRAISLLLDAVSLARRPLPARA